MEEVKKLLDEGRHVEFVEQLNELEERIRDARNKKDQNTVEKLRKEEAEILRWCESYIKTNKLTLQEPEMINLSCVLGVYLAKKRDVLKTTQIRKMLDRFNSIESDKDKFDKKELIKLKPILAYTSARHNESKELVRILDSSIGRINSFDEFKKLCEFLRGVVAYHKLAGGGD
jgi:CRISPR type III-A-associated protein Csm2